MVAVASVKSKNGKANKSKKKSSTTSTENPSKAKGPSVPVKPKAEIVYPEINVMLFTEGYEGVMTPEKAKEILGWQEETENVKFDHQYILMDHHGHKVRCSNNQTNRPFNAGLAHDWSLEVLRKKWRLNGETIIIDRTGMVQDGQHRLAGLVLAEQLRQQNKEHWSEYWRQPCDMEVLVVVGIDESDDTVNTIGVGKPRTTADVFYRSTFFMSKPPKQRIQAAKIGAFAVKLIWRRTGTNLVKEKAYVPKRSHSESLEFLEKHLRIIECVNFIQDMDQGKRLAKLVPLGSAAGLMFLMGSSASDMEEYDAVGSQEALDWKLWDKTCDFWTRLAEGDKKLKPLQDALIKIDATGSLGLGEKSGTVVKAWNAFSDGHAIVEEDIQVLMSTDEYGMPCLGESPRCGGIDVGEQIEIEED